MTIAEDNHGPAPDLPLVVDLDGTLTPTDTLVESVVQLARRNFTSALLLPWQLLRGRAHLKAWVSDRVALDVTRLPYREDLLQYLRRERDAGRTLVLATAADRRIADAVAGHLGLFDQVLHSDGVLNLKGAAKLQAIQSRVGADFVYAGDSRADLAVWPAARGALLVGKGAAFRDRVQGLTRIEGVFPDAHGTATTWFKALRIHQWLKNLLIFVPLLTAGWDAAGSHFPDLLTAFLSFSLLASATYMFNDLWDLESDRMHARKRRRPFASGALSPVTGMACCLILLAISLGIAVEISIGFAAMLTAYLATTLSYSLVLKRYVLIDVLALAALYTLRILAGALIVDVELSPWLLAFSVFLFFSLALLKRCSELVSLGREGAAATRGRDYAISDLVVLWPLGASSAFAAVVVFGLFINAPETAARYDAPMLLWLTAFALIYWIARMWIKCARGEMHDDPIVFALRDRGCRMTLIAMVLTAITARIGTGVLP